MENSDIHFCSECHNMTFIYLNEEQDLIHYCEACSKSESFTSENACIHTTSINKYDNSTNNVAAGHSATNAVLFMYHPHGKPDGAVTWEADGSHDNTLTGSSTSKEDIYWIYYAPRTSSNGSSRGRDLDGYVMSAWKNMALDWDFDGVMEANGTATDGGDDPLPDLTTLYEPN